MTDIFRLRVLAAEYGDCLWVEYGDADALHRVLIDAGTPGTFERLKPLLDEVRSEKPSHQLLIVTHIDADHIGGCLPLLEDGVIARQFEEVWFNGRHHLLQSSEEESFGAVQGERLTAALLESGVPWNKSFDGRAVVRDEGAVPASFPLKGGAEIVILSPTMTQLRKLLPKWDRELKKAGLDPIEPPVVQQVVDGQEVLGAIDVDKLADTPTPEDAAEANGSSIAVLLRVGTLSALFAADAHPSVLAEGIRHYSGGKKLKVDVFKLPHHGSKANVTDELLELVDAKVLVFSTNGKCFHHPDQEAVARVVRRYRGSARLAFNYDTQYNKIWKAKSLRDEWCYDVEYGRGEDGLTINVHDL